MKPITGVRTWKQVFAEVNAQQAVEAEAPTIHAIGETCEIDKDAGTDTCFGDYFCEENSMTCWAHACKYHEDCHASSDLQCVHGQCFPSEKLVGIHCTADEECLPETFTCDVDPNIMQCKADTCATDEDCGDPDLWCKLGLWCVPFRRPNMDCQKDEQCVADLICNGCSKTCTWDECLNHRQCGYKEMCIAGKCDPVDSGYWKWPCEQDSDCMGNQVCNLDVDECWDIQCETTEECGDWEACEYGRCMPAGFPSEGGHCQTDDECFEDYACRIDDITGEGQCWMGLCDTFEDCAGDEHYCSQGECV